MKVSERNKCKCYFKRLAISHEAVDAQMESMSKSTISSRDQVNSVKQQKFQTKGRGHDPKKGGTNNPKHTTTATI